MNILFPKIVFHDTPNGGWYCNECKQYIHYDLVHSHKCGVKPL